MTTFLAVLLVFSTVIAAMAVGVIFKRRPLAGSCGGLGSLGLGKCDVCGNDPAKCEKKAPAV